jgi:hypothetical protein
MEVDLTPITNELFKLASIALIGVLSWASMSVKRYFNIKADFDAGVVLKEAIENGMKRAEAMLAGPDGKISIHMKNYFAAKAAEYVIQQVPDKLRELRINEDMVRDMIDARVNPQKFANREVSTTELASAGVGMPSEFVEPSGAH